MQVQPHGSHSRARQAAPPPRKLPLHLPSTSPITGARAEQAVGELPQGEAVVGTLPRPGALTSSSKLMEPRAEPVHSTLCRTSGPRTTGVKEMQMVLLPPAGTTTCLGLMENGSSEGTPSRPCRVTEMISWEAPALEPPSACGPGVAEAHAGSRPTGHSPAALPPPLLTDWAASRLDLDTSEGLGDQKELLVSGHRRPFPAWSRSAKGGP